MTRAWTLLLRAAVLAALAIPGSYFGAQETAQAAGPAPLLVSGDFEKETTGADLRAREKTQGWYESRGDGAEGEKLLTLSEKPVAGNATKKAMIKGDPKFNTYLSQAFSQPQEGSFSCSPDIPPI